MKFLYCKLKNYIGIYNGLGLNEIEIDFSKGKHKKILIIGDNGSGKSELLKSLSMFPDTSDRLIPGLPAEKIITVLEGKTMYTGRIKHGINNNGKRETTKAYLIRQTQFGEPEELNPNGNIGSYKELLYTELNLDPCFILLSSLSSLDRGLADKKPVERKKAIVSMLSSVEVYNNIHKTMSKRSSVYKSIINSITSKIDNIGDEQQLITLLSSLDNRLESKNTMKNNLLETLGSYKFKINSLDPTGSIQQLFDKIYKDLESINLKLDNFKIDFPYIKDREITEELISQFYSAITVEKENLISKQARMENSIDNLLKERESISSKINDKDAKLTSCIAAFNEEQTLQGIEICNQNIANYRNVIDSMGIEPNNITKDEFIIGLNVLNEIKESISTFRSYMSLGTITKAVNYLRQNSYPNIDEEKVSVLRQQLQNLELEYQKYATLLEVSRKLSLRPSNCNIETCGFIKDALQANKQNPQENMDRINIEIKELNTKIEQLISKNNESKEICDCINYLKVMLRSFNNNFNIINKLPIRNVLSNKDELLDRIVNGYRFDEIDELYKFIDQTNVIDLYNNEIEKLNRYNSELQIHKNDKKMIDELKSDIVSLSDESISISNELSSLSDELKSVNEDLKENQRKYTSCELVLSQINNKKKMIETKNQLISQFNGIKDNITQIKECTNYINDLNNQIFMLENEIKPINEDRDRIKHGLKLLKEYHEELAQYNSKYEKIELIKKYSSPNKGIQTLFMLLYMDKTISLSNQLLQLLFDGKFSLGKYEINESEFRIPCMGNNIPNEDISSMSNAQVCMISMIISFVLLRQSSTKYNIIKLDEIDGALDTNNRLYVMQVLDKLIDLLEIDQCIMISHNSEINLHDCDIIQLKSNEILNVSEDNYIYKL